MKTNKNLNIDAISIIVPGCNLSCEYCLIAKAEKTAIDLSNNIKLTKKAILDGTYLNNILIGLNRLNVNPENIKHFEIWGGEPTLIFKELSLVWK